MIKNKEKVNTVHYKCIAFIFLHPFLKSPSFLSICYCKEAVLISEVNVPKLSLFLSVLYWKFYCTDIDEYAGLIREIASCIRIVYS